MRLTGVIILTLFILISCSENVHRSLKLGSITSIDSTLTFRGIFAVNENKGYVSGNRGSFYKTKNGGDDWDKIIIPGAENADFRDIEILSDGSILILSIGTSTDSKIYKSKDSGRIWEAVYTNKYKSGFLNSFAFIDF